MYPSFYNSVNVLFPFILIIEKEVECYFYLIEGILQLYYILLEITKSIS